MKNFISMALVVLVLASCTGCNMLKGAGKDVENAGKGVQKTVEHND